MQAKHGRMQKWFDLDKLPWEDQFFFATNTKSGCDVHGGADRGLISKDFGKTDLLNMKKSANSLLQKHRSRHMLQLVTKRLRKMTN